MSVVTSLHPTSLIGISCFCYCFFLLLFFACSTRSFSLFLLNIIIAPDRMRPVVTDVAWSVCLCVGHSRNPAKTDEPIETQFRNHD